MHFHDMQRNVYKTNRSNGWWDKLRNVPELLCLVHSEISEALEAYRNPDIEEGTYVRNIPGFGEELADIVIRVMDMAEHFGIPLDKEIYMKNLKNQLRGYRHGGKRV